MEMRVRIDVVLAVLVIVSGCAASTPDASPESARQQVLEISGDTSLRGKEAVADAWRRYFGAEEAPFSWEPESVEVLESGSLALSSGPVFDGAGDRIGSFTSVWRREAPGVWRIVFDRGS
jgi:ketosteroid isomerase-like protein